MVRFFVAASAASLILASPALAETQSYDVPAFTGLDVSSGLDVTFETGPAQSVIAENRNGDFDSFEIEVKDGVLRLSRSGGGMGILNWNNRPNYDVTVTAPVLSTVKVSSGADVSGTGLSGEVVVTASSGAEASISEITAGTVSLSSSSGSDIDVSGTCASVTANSSSGSDIDASGLICQTGEADASSGSDIELHVTESVSASASSGADVDVEGNPSTVDVSESSGGSVDIDA